MEVELALMVPAAITFICLVATLWAVPDDHEVLKVCGTLAIVAEAFVLALGYSVAFQMLSPREHVETEVLETYEAFVAAVRDDDFQTAWVMMCPEYRRSTTLERFENGEADQLATMFGRTLVLRSPETVVVSPGMWSGGAHVTIIRSDFGWCLLELSGWSFD